MAYVAISKDLIERVKSNIRHMNRSEVVSSCPTIAVGKSVSKDASALFTRGCWGARAHLLELIPKDDWCSPLTSVDIYVYGSTTVNDVLHNVRTGIRFTDLTNAWGQPERNSYYPYTRCDFHIDDLRALPEEMAGRSELLAVYEEAVTQTGIDVRWAKIMSDMVEFLHKCKSLNEAIKLFPAVKMYVDKHDIERMERKVERAPRQDLTADVDTDGITAAAIAVKLMGAA